MFFRKAIKNLVSRSIPAGVLQLALGIGLIISVICFSIILLFYYSRLALIDQEVNLKLSDNALSGIEYLISKRTELKFNEPAIIDLYRDGIDSVTLIRRPWGVFERITAEAFQGPHRSVKDALVTLQNNDVGNAAIYLTENNSPLYLAGETRLEGKAYLPERKLSPGYVENSGFEGTALIRGEIVKSTRQLPALDTTLLHALRELQFDPDNSVYRLRHVEKLSGGHHKTLVKGAIPYYRSSSTIEIADSIFDSIIITSREKIVLLESSFLSDAILIAPVIEVLAGKHGSAQLIGQHFIRLQEGASLRYPSAAILLGSQRDSLIVIEKNAELDGIIVVPGENADKESRGRLLIGEDGRFQGSAFINGAADIQGCLWGHIACRRFELWRGETMYPNQLFNAEISSKKKSVYLPGTLLWGYQSKQVIAKWIR